MAEYRKKLIEVALPLSDINDASSYDKMPGIGPHPKGIHHWWARLPLPTARAILFASVVDDPASHPEIFKTEKSQNEERYRLFTILQNLMMKKLYEHPDIYEIAQKEMKKYCKNGLPTVLDPFAGGGSIPLEANRLGFKSYATDLNPIAVLLNKCNLELLPRWNNYPPVNSIDHSDILRSTEWKGTRGFSEDLKYYGNKVKDKAIKQIGDLYPRIKLPKTFGNKESNVIAWLWARTIASPNPVAKGVHVPLIRSFWLSTKKDKEAYIIPLLDKDKNEYVFEVRNGRPKDNFDPSKGTVKRTGARCLLYDTPIDFNYIKNEGRNGRIGYRLIAIVAEQPRGKIYLSPTIEHEQKADIPLPKGYPETEIPQKALGFRVQPYGIDKHYKCFTNRQLKAMVVLSDLIKEVQTEILNDAKNAGLEKSVAEEYSISLTTFLALALDRCADFNCSLSTWKPSGQQQMHLFTRQAIPMVWDFAEANILGEKAICWHNAVEITAESINSFGECIGPTGYAKQIDAASDWNEIKDLLISTDPPYYDNIGYAVLSDFFYIWLRRTIGNLYPNLFSTILVPKDPELTASPERFENSKEKAKEHFESGFRKAFTSLKNKMSDEFPLTVYYAFKQEDDEISNDGEDETQEKVLNIDRTTGWETLLEALISSGFEVTATWPVRASQAWRMRSMGSNALASYIVLACRKRANDASLTTRKSFVSILKKEIPDALKKLQNGNIAPVDLAQASIGPGMAIFSRYAKVLEADGSAMEIRTALSLINEELDIYLSEQEGELDRDTRFCIDWYTQNCLDSGSFGEADTLARAKNTSVQGLVESGVVFSKAGKVRLLRRDEYPNNWNPISDNRINIWECTQHLIRSLEIEGEKETSKIVSKLGGLAENARALSYRLFSICEKKGWAQEALSYNSLVIAWPEIIKLSRETGKGTEQTSLF